MTTNENKIFTLRINKELFNIVSAEAKKQRRSIAKQIEYEIVNFHKELKNA